MEVDTGRFYVPTKQGRWSLLGVFREPMVCTPVTSGVEHRGDHVDYSAIWAHGGHQGGHHRTHWARDVIGLAVVGSENREKTDFGRYRHP